MRSELGHAVHPEVTGLVPDREFSYRFRVLGPGGALSPVGRTRTTPRPGDAPSSLAFASCQKWSDGYTRPVRRPRGRERLGRGRPRVR